MSEPAIVRIADALERIATSLEGRPLGSGNPVLAFPGLRPPGWTQGEKSKRPDGPEERRMKAGLNILEPTTRRTVCQHCKQEIPAGEVHIHNADGTKTTKNVFSAPEPTEEQVALLGKAFESANAHNQPGVVELPKKPDPA